MHLGPVEPTAGICSYSTRVKLGVAFVVLVTLTRALRQLPSTISSFHTLPQTDDISQYERRFSEVKHFLPPNQFVAYRDEFDKASDQCDAYFLAQYSLAPTVLVAPDNNKCRGGEQLDAYRSRLVLDNFHDPGKEPYLLQLFPNSYFKPHKHVDFSAEGRLAGAGNVVLYDDASFGVELYSRGQK